MNDTPTRAPVALLLVLAALALVLVLPAEGSGPAAGPAGPGGSGVTGATAARARGTRAQEAVAAGREMMLGLRDGSVLWGGLVDHDERGIEFLRLDNGGQVRLPWDLLDPRFEEELRTRLGYLDLSEDEVTVKVEAFPLVGGGEVVGRVVERTSDAIHVRSGSTTVAIPKTSIAGPATLVRVPALDVYTRDELYLREVAARRDGLDATGVEGARAHFDMARYCERILDYAHAVQHYRRAAELAPGHRPRDTEVALARAERKAAAQEQVDYLGEIRRERRRGNYERATEMIAAFGELFPESPLFEELHRVRLSVERARTDELVATVERSWHEWASRLASRAARELDLAQARSYATERMGDEIVARVHEEVLEIDPRLAPGDVRTLWKAREGHRVHRASYGLGTWLLGEDEARAGLVEATEAGDDEEPTERELARRDIEERIRRFLDRQSGSGGGSAGASEADPAEFWDRWTAGSRAQWILARYAEAGGDVELSRVRFRACPQCGGTGVREIVHAGPAVSGGSADRTRRVTCPTCQHVGIVRRVTYR